MGMPWRALASATLSLVLLADACLCGRVCPLLCQTFPPRLPLYAAAAATAAATTATERQLSPRYQRYRWQSSRRIRPTVTAGRRRRRWPYCADERCRGSSSSTAHRWYGCRCTTGSRW
uniref:Putative secreted protein n=1 Tax=Anopheles darlingi TaxID=43151 RepID=A0A2M4D8Z6_ANODA